MEVGLTLIIGYIGIAAVLVYIASQFNEESGILSLLKLLFITSSILVLIVGSSSMSEFVYADNSTNSTNNFIGQSDAVYSGLMYLLIFFVSLFGLYIIVNLFEYFRGIQAK